MPTEPTEEELRAEELVLLKEKLAARKGKPGFKQNAIDIQARIDELEAMNGD